MQTCLKLSIDTRGPLMESMSDLKDWQAFIREDGGSGSYWMPRMWNGEKWNDWFSGKVDDSLYGGTGNVQIYKRASVVSNFFRSCTV